MFAMPLQKMHMDTGNRAWNSELSTIDTALLIAGILTAAQYFDREDDETETEIRALATFIYERVDWRWALNKGDTIAMASLRQKRQISPATVISSTTFLLSSVEASTFGALRSASGVSLSLEAASLPMAYS